ncbi:hypothetical protein NG2371_01393 [Nocardia gamkensis]|uniref:DUF305 domain-containing protein n=1 Tax=Nocardia gamkensis TaxID=352869 RepID=A0A7X6R5E3_9NOCA|nr:DUF305 domain-containing protein [Nocardia gamkensis]NQE66945.1 hypothetical protein [Nocardia gamkensis]
MQKVIASGNREASSSSSHGATGFGPEAEAEADSRETPAGSGERGASTRPGGREAAVSGDREFDGSERETGAGVGGQFRRQRTALLILGIIGAILIGFAIGVLARIPLNGSTEPDPGPVDVGFSQDMSAHHAQAVEMAGVLLVRSTDTEVRRLAYDILTTQQSQIGRMQGWLQLWGEPAQSVDGFMGWMTEPMGGHDHSGADMPHHSGPVSTMPGMATPAELAALRQATSPKLDTMFLQLMLRHHQGGLSMIDYAAQHADTTAVRTLAETMATTQRGESDLMTTMLTARGAAPLP